MGKGSLLRIFSLNSTLLFFVILRTALSFGTESKKSASPHLLWTHRMKGAIAKVSLDGSGKNVMVMTYPDPDIEGSGNHYLLSRLDREGRVKWQVPQPAVPKEQDLAWDGSNSVVSNFENELFLLDGNGKRLWTVEASCKPSFATGSKKIYCFHDDNIEVEGLIGPGVGNISVLDIFDETGKKISEIHSTSDLVANKFSSDGKSYALGFSNGEVRTALGLDDGHQVLKVQGRIVDLAISSSLNRGSKLGAKSGPSSNKLAVLYWQPTEGNSSEKKQWIAVYDSIGQTWTEKPKLFPVPDSFRAAQVELAPSGEVVFYYGVSSQGQSVGGFVFSDVKSTWELIESKPSDYLASIVVAKDQVIQGINHVTRQGRVPKVRGIDFKGHPIWEITLPGDPGAYIYSLELSQDGKVLAVGLDDGHLNLIQLK